MKSHRRHLPCPKCGFGSACLHGYWWDRHPWPAAILGIPVALITLSAMAAHWWMTIPITGIVSAVILNHLSRKRQAAAARADWEHQQQLLSAMQEYNRWAASINPLLLAVKPRQPAPWHIITQLPTAPIGAK